MKRSELQHGLAMTVALISWGMLFVTLFMGYAVYRSNAEVWPPIGVSRVPLNFPFVSTVLIVLSSWFCHKARQLVLQSDLRGARKNVLWTIFLGLGFMISQGVVWFQMQQAGLFVSTGIFASIMYGFTWIHAAHVVCGILALVYLFIVTKPATERLVSKAHNVEKFWHFLGIIWILMFVGMFVF